MKLHNLIYNELLKELSGRAVPLIEGWTSHDQEKPSRYLHLMHAEAGRASLRHQRKWGEANNEILA
jgi:hypothetical protein